MAMQMDVYSVIALVIVAAGIGWAFYYEHFAK